MIFINILTGVSSERRNNEIKRLNQAYLETVATKNGLDECLDHMVQTESYRWICKATYSLCPEPIRSQRICDLEPEINTVQDSVRILHDFLLVHNITKTIFQLGRHIGVADSNH